MKSTPQIMAIPVPKGNHHPSPTHSPILPTHEFTWGVISPKGAGKTTFLINMLKFYKGYFHEIIIFSPTILNDDKWDYVKKLPLRSRNDKLLDFLESLESEEKEVDENKMFPDLKNEIKEQRKKFVPQIPEKNFVTDYDEGTLAKVIQQQNEMIEFLKSNGKSKHWANRVLLLFDDLVGSDLFNNRRDSVFKGFNTRHRHLGMSVFMVTQAYMEIPKTVRTQYTCLTAFRIGSDKEIEAIYREFPMGLSRKEWDAMYEFCTKGAHDFMFIDFQKPRGQQIMKNFDTFIEEG